MLKRLLWICSGSPESSSLPDDLPLSVERAGSIFEALELLSQEDFDAVLASFPHPDWTAEELLEELHRNCPSVPVIIRDPEMPASQAVRLARLGAHECLDASASDEHVSASIEGA